MLYASFRNAAAEAPDRVFANDGSRSLTYSDALEAVAEVGKAIRPAEVYYLHMRDGIDLFLLLIALDQMGCRSCILNQLSGVKELSEVESEIGEGIIYSDTLKAGGVSSPILPVPRLSPGPRQDLMENEAHSPTRSGLQAGTIVILTTGTTGPPKPVLYDWATLVSQVHAKNVSDFSPNWLLIYPLNHFAGIQQLLHVVVNRETITIPKSRSYEDVVQAIRDFNVSSVSATPTFWRFFVGRLDKGTSQTIELKQITLGGEASTQGLLTKLKDSFPRANIVQIYATTEIGSSFAVNDGLEGFPREYLERRVGNVELKIVEGELYVKSAKRMRGYLGSHSEDMKDMQWIPSGDLVEIVDNRVRFLGRKSEVVNVGGVKVHPQKVERVVLRVNGIENVRVYGKANPIVGQIVVADIKLINGVQAAETTRKVEEECARELSRYEIPREIRIVADFEKRNEKLVRT